MSENPFTAELTENAEKKLKKNLCVLIPIKFERLQAPQ